MNSFVFAALIATASAQEGYTCTNLDGDDAWTVIDDEDTVTDADDAEACKAACLAIAEADDNAESDYCCAAKDTAKADDDTAAEFECALYQLEATDDEADIREAEETDEDADPVVTHSAWAWTAGDALDEMASATMISSAIATIASVAMIAY
jgi:hypothetical protein